MQAHLNVEIAVHGIGAAPAWAKEAVERGAGEVPT